MNTAIIIFKHNKKSAELEVPLNITADELVDVVNTVFKTGVDLEDSRQRFLKSESPLALLKGSKTLEEYKIRTGTVITL